MTPADAQNFFALLTIAAMVGTIALVALRVVTRLRHLSSPILDGVGQYANHLAAAVTTTSMLGSLYFSEVANYVPCTLCWYQRIAMYPAAVILLIATWKRDRRVRTYALPLVAIGAVISTYHYLLERFPDLDAGVCSVEVPCEFVWFEQFGFITLPFMALTAFVASITLLTLPIKD